MEEMVKFKKCPYCELNYISETDYCCEVCYESSKKIREEVIAQRIKDYKKRQISLELQHLENKTTLEKKKNY